MLLEKKGVVSREKILESIKEMKESEGERNNKLGN